jgi:two-component system, cell cycle sensor histidine kinase and response regulator CckA
MENSETFKLIEGTDLNVEFKDIFELEYIQKLQTLFSDAFGVSSLVTDVNGKAITKTYNYCTLCRDIVRKSTQGMHDCGVMERLLSKHHNEGPLIRECENTGLWEAGVNIMVGGKLIGSWIIGQVQSDYKYDSQIKDLSKKLGVNQEEYTLALYDIPIMPMKTFENIANMLYTYINDIANNRYSILQLKKYISDKVGK